MTILQYATNRAWVNPNFEPAESSYVLILETPDSKQHPRCLYQFKDTLRAYLQLLHTQDPETPSALIKLVPSSHIYIYLTHTHTPQQPANVFWSDPDSLPDVEPEYSVCIQHFGNGAAVLTKCKANRQKLLRTKLPLVRITGNMVSNLQSLNKMSESKMSLNVDTSLTGMTRYDKVSQGMTRHAFSPRSADSLRFRHHLAALESCVAVKLVDLLNGSNGSGFGGICYVLTQKLN